MLFPDETGLVSCPLTPSGDWCKICIWSGVKIDGSNSAVFTVVMGTSLAVVLWEWGRMPREYHGGGVRVCSIPAVMGIGDNYSISKQTQCCKICKKKQKMYISINVSMILILIYNQISAERDVIKVQLIN